MPLFYRKEKLHLGSEDPSGEGRSIELASLVGPEDGPVYVYDLDGMCEQVKSLRKAMKNQAHVHYAVKANSNPRILKAFAELGIGADVVSGGEIKAARDAGIPAEKIIFSGVGKTVKEIALALTEKVGQINVESVAELKRIADIATRLQVSAPVAFRFNPDVNPETHPYITTGFRENKFGLAKEQLEEFLGVIDKNPQLKLQGLALHIGSQLLEIQSLGEAIRKAVAVYQELQNRGYRLSTFDVGGGIGIDYQKGRVSEKLVDEYGAMVTELLAPLDTKILCEPGRLIVGVHGVLLGEVQYIKNNGFRKFAILNTGMHHLMRPSLYQAYHRILPVSRSVEPEVEYDVVGPICESSDVLGRARVMPKLQEGDWLAIGEAGAYGMSMASGYNAHAKPRELVFFNGQVLTDIPVG